MGADINRLQEDLETNGNLLEETRKALRKAENSKNRSTNSTNRSTVESSGRVEAKAKRAMMNRNRSHGGTFGGLRTTQKRQETKQAAVLANGN